MRTFYLFYQEVYRVFMVSHIALKHAKIPAVLLILSMSLNMFGVLAAVAGLALGTPSSSTTRTLDLEPVYTNGSITVEHLSVPGNLDGFKMLTPAARKSADFWYFDVFSSATNQTLNIVFFNSGEFSQYPHPLAVQVSGLYPNGTDFYFEAMADSGVTLSNGPNGIAGDWKGIGSFKGTALDKPNVEYSIEIDSAEMGIHGTINFQSVRSFLANIKPPFTYTV